MKRILLPVVLAACAAAACAPAPSDNANANAPNTNAANINAANTNTASTAGPADADIIAREREVYDDIKKKDTAALGAMLADDFVLVSDEAGPPVNKADTIKMISKGEYTNTSLSDFKVVRIDKDAAVVIYNSEGQMTSGGKTTPVKDRESSVWVNRGGKWVALFHQECDIRPPMPPPAAGASNSNSANSNAAANSNKPATSASPAATTADAEANEKMVWDAIKRQDAAAFSGFLADDAMEVESEGVYNKTQSVGTVTSLPFLSSVTLSDWKTLKIDDDASIVMYTVKGTGPDKKPFTDHHTTVWANRAGRWLAVFHHGTPIGPPPPPAAANK